MTLQELIETAGQHPWVLLAIFAILPLVPWILGRFHGPYRGSLSPWKYAYSAIVYASCVPGICAAVLTGYALFFIRSNLLEVNFLVYLLPVASMVATLILVSKNVRFDRIPGFDRLSGLMVLLGVSFAIALVIAKTRVWVFFGSHITSLFVVAVGAFLLLKWATDSLFRRGDEPKRDHLEL